MPQLPQAPVVVGYFAKGLSQFLQRPNGIRISPRTKGDF